MAAEVSLRQPPFRGPGARSVPFVHTQWTYAKQPQGSLRKCPDARVSDSVRSQFYQLSILLLCLQGSLSNVTKLNYAMLQWIYRWNSYLRAQRRLELHREEEARLLMSVLAVGIMEGRYLLVTVASGEGLAMQVPLGSSIIIHHPMVLA